jgi:hypothetical protein
MLLVYGAVYLACSAGFAVVVAYPWVSDRAGLPDLLRDMPGYGFVVLLAAAAGMAILQVGSSLLFGWKAARVMSTWGHSERRFVEAIGAVGLVLLLSGPLIVLGTVVVLLYLLSTFAG